MSVVYIVASGVRTPVGVRAASAAAAVRAGIVALRDHPFMIDQAGERMPGALDPGLDPGVTGPDRLLALAQAALLEACLPFAAADNRPVRVPVFVGLPELRPGFTLADFERVRGGMTRWSALPIEPVILSMLTRGHAAGLLAFAQALDYMQQEKADVCLVGGVDSYFHPDTMEWLDDNRQLAGAVSRSGFIPGEGAGFCLLMKEGPCRAFGLSPRITVRAVAVGRELKLIKTEDVCLGEGLSATVSEVVQQLGPGQRVNHVICDMNGERYRGEEWGFVCLRLGHWFDDPTAYLSPAESWGDVGAASGPLFAMLACEAAARGYAKGSRTMLWASSEGGDRGVAVLEDTADVE